MQQRCGCGWRRKERKPSFRRRGNLDNSYPSLVKGCARWSECADYPDVGINVVEQFAQDVSSVVIRGKERGKDESKRVSKSPG